MQRKRFGRRALATATALAMGVGLYAGLAPTTGLASSHREAPLVSADPQVDNTDVYAFVSPDEPDRVNLISSWIPFEEPAGGPNFYPWAPGVHYDIKIDNDGDARADLVYRWIFHNHRRDGGDSFLYANGSVDSLNDENLLFAQTHLAMLKFHNKVCDQLAASGKPAGEIFEEARQIVTWHYQWMVLHDFVERLIGAG